MARHNAGAGVTLALVVAGLSAILALVTLILADRPKSADRRTAAHSTAIPGIEFPDPPIPVPVLTPTGPAPGTSPTGTVTKRAAPIETGHPRRPPTPVRHTVTTKPARTGPIPAAPGLTPGRRVSLEPAELPGTRVRHRHFRARIDRMDRASELDRADTTFTVRSGLADARCVSLESVNYPGRYLRHRNFALVLDRSGMFAADATLCPVTVAPGRIVLRSLNYPDRYLVVRGSLLFLDRVPARRAMALVVRPPL
jgi:hypothetical protein